MKTKFLSAVSFALLTFSPMLLGMDMGHEHHAHYESAESATETIKTSGTVKQIADNHESLRIFHDPIPALKWPSMNMPFEVIDHELTHPLEVGDKVDFEFIQKDGKNIIVQMKKQ